ncbi:ribosomal S17, partial [Opisthorchis viverrini]
MVRVRTITVKNASRFIIERFSGRLTRDFHTNKKACQDIACINSKRLRNKIAGYVTHLMKRLETGNVRGISVKMQEEEPEITLLDGATCVYRSSSDVYFYVIGDAAENELLLVSALNCLYDSVAQILKRCVEKKTVLDNLDLIFLVVDELCNDGYVLLLQSLYLLDRILMECDPTALVSRIGTRTEDIPLGEQTVAQ